jgi:signal transduction histidine kinase
MNIKARIFIFNLINIIIPLAIAGIFSAIYFFVNINFININKNMYDINTYAMKEFEMLEYQNKLMLKKDKLQDENFQKNIVKELELNEIEIIVLKDDNILFSSIDKISLIDLENIYNENNKISIKNIEYLMKSSQIKFYDNSKGKIIILNYIDENILYVKNFLILIIIVFAVSYIITFFILSKLYTKKIINPLRKLVEITEDISKGNLENEIVEDGDKEIANLFMNFEKMRIKLKSLINEKIKMDDSRKIMITSISHDLKTPITSIKGYIESIVDGIIKDSDKINYRLNKVLEKAETINKMIDDLFFYSKLDLKKISFNIEIIDIGSYFDYCIDDIEQELKKDSINLELKNNLKEQIIIDIDREKFQRVIMNIIDNSRKYINKENGKIDIILKEVSKNILIEIKDNGMGIEESNLNLIFERFYRSDIARSKTSGSGLGLAITKEIVIGLGGEIWARSKIGEWTSILISFRRRD